MEISTQQPQQNTSTDIPPAKDIPTQKPEVPKRNYSLIFLKTLFILTALAMATLTIYLGYQKYQLKNQLKEKQNQLAQEENNMQEQTNEADSWKTYKNENEGIEFKYPDTWIIANHPQYPYPEVRFFNEGEQPNFSEGDSKGNEIAVMMCCDVYNNKSPDEVIDEKKAIYSVMDSYTITKIKVADKDGLIDSNRNVVIFFNGNALSFGFYQNSINLIEKILSTFKFSDQTASSVSWDKAKELIANCEVEMVMQAHSLNVSLKLKEGTTVSTKEPQIDLVLTEVDNAKEKCGDIAVATE